MSWQLITVLSVSYLVFGILTAYVGIRHDWCPGTALELRPGALLIIATWPVWAFVTTIWGVMNRFTGWAERRG